jgi:hypothetical protein
MLFVIVADDGLWYELGAKSIFRGCTAFPKNAYNIWEEITSKVIPHTLQAVHIIANQVK